MIYTAVLFGSVAVGFSRGGQMLVSRSARASAPSSYVTDILAQVRAKNPAEPEFHQAVEEVLESLDLVVNRRPELAKAKILERIVEPERVIMFRVPWQDDRGDRKSTRLNSSHSQISYAVFCLKKKKQK